MEVFAFYEEGFLPPRRMEERFIIGISIMSAIIEAARSVSENSEKNSARRFSAL